MRHRLVLVCLGMMLAVGAAAAPKAHWSKTTHNFGLVAETKGTAEAVFLVSNDGDENISILDVNGTCGCTRMEYTRHPIKPGEKGSVRVTFDPRNLLGEFTRKVYVKLKGADSDGATLTLSGTVLGSDETIRRKFPVKSGELYFDNPEIDFGKVDLGSEATVYIEIYNSSTREVTPELHGLPECIDFSALPIPPGQSRSMPVVFKPSKAQGCRPGDFKETLSLPSGAIMTLKAKVPKPATR